MGATSSITSTGRSPSTSRLQNHIETEIEVHRPRSKPRAAQPKPEEPHQDEQGRTATMRVAEDALPAPCSAVLRSLDGGPSIELTQRRMKLGRSATCDIPWNLPGVSGEHCEFTFEGSWWTVKDLDSKNGIQVNGVDVSSQMLMPGDRLTIARTYQFQILDPNAEPERLSPVRFWLWIAALMTFTTLSGLAAWWFTKK